MNTLPSSIESYLEEAGFTVLEVLILKRLLEEEALTVREIASKTGKSSGAIDQAMRRLLQKNIVTKEQINGTWKYTLHSLKAVSQWMMEDMKEKREAMTRRHQNFESFLTTLELDKKRPDIEYFDGDEGMKRAYMSILGYAKETLHYMPVICAIEDDPLRDFRVEYFRERRRKGVFSRVIAHNTSLGRRYQSRDPFEYRQTVLVPEDQYPFTFEKVIAGDMIACFNFTEKRASLIHYPELASMERGIFEGIWKKGMGETQKDSLVDVVPVPTPAKAPTVPLRTRTFSRLREFFLSKESLVTLGAFAFVAAIATYGFYKYTYSLNYARMRQEAQSIASTGAVQFDVNDLNALQVEEDWKKPEWKKVVMLLEQIRKINPDVTFVYLLRRVANKPNKFEFIADSHSINPYANTDDNPFNDVDANGDGQMSPNDEDFLQWPGQPYLTAPEAAKKAFNGAIASEVYQDQWGKYFTGYAPIKDSEGNAVAVLAVDFGYKKPGELTAKTFFPIIWFLVIFFIFVIVRLAAFNRSLLQEVWEVFQMKKTLYVVLLCAEIAYLVTFSLYFYNLYWVKYDNGTYLKSVAEKAAPLFTDIDLSGLRFARDMKKPEYQEAFKELNQIREDNPRIKYTYLMRPILLPDMWEFIVDADSNYNIPHLWMDYNNDGIVNFADENVAPGIRYYTNNETCFIEALKKSTHSDFYSDQWGTWISGCAPVRDKLGSVVAILGLDMDVSKVYENLEARFTLLLWFFGFFSLLLFSRLIFKRV